MSIRKQQKSFENGRVWKRYGFATMDALHERGLITEPRDRQESVYLTDEGLRRAEELAARHFGTRMPLALQKGLLQQTVRKRVPRY